MKKLLLAGAAVAVLAGSTAVYAQHRPWMHHQMRMDPADRAAFADARIAAVKAGLKLTPDQEKLWPAVETSVRDFAKLRIDRANARMEERKAREDNAKNDTPPNPVERLQKRVVTFERSSALVILAYLLVIQRGRREIAAPIENIEKAAISAPMIKIISA